MRTTNSGGKRGGFTLIELLVVISIIAVLAALLVPAVMKALVVGVETTARGDINDLSMAHAAFRQEFGVSYIPSRIRLVESGAYNTADPLQKQTVLFLQSMFGTRANLAGNWNNNGNPNETLDLAGEECLTFFLGGIPSNSGPNACLGFSTDPSMPCQLGGKRRGPFYDFKSNRLVRQAANGFFMYQDPFNAIGKPAFYVYLSSTKAGNDYSADSRQGVQPYFQSGGVFMNRDGFQIITAGRDGMFGPGGGAWSPAGGYGTSSTGSDDLANFSRARLALGQS